MRNWTTVIGLGVIGGGILVVVFLVMSGGGRPVSEEIRADSAQDFYAVCASMINGTVHDPAEIPGDQAKHPNLFLRYRTAIHQIEFPDLFRSATFIGVIRNDTIPGPPDDIGDEWTTTPAKDVCVFIGGDKTGLFARLVWKVGNVYKGRKREVAARFHTNNHNREKAQWDKDIQGYKAFTSEMLPQDLDKRGGSARLEGGPGTWYTCATNTCCKIL